jgi:hypothetical protein
MRQYVRTILGITETGEKYNNVWMAVERSKGGPVQAMSFTPAFNLPPGTYDVSSKARRTAVRRTKSPCASVSATLAISLRNCCPPAAEAA